MFHPRITSLLLAGLGLFAIPDATFAQSKRRSRAIACPPIIADTQAGTVKKVKVRKGVYKCFRSESDAKRDGFLPVKALNKLDYSGWWRIKIKDVDDSCGRFKSNSGLVLFLQLVQHGDALFGDYCPDLGRIVGSTIDYGVSLSRTATRKELNGPLACSDSTIEVTEKLEMRRVLDGTVNYKVKLTNIRRCPGLEEGMLTCTTVMNGVAFPETHKIWPAVQQNTSKLQNACSVALDRCSECHENLTEPPHEP